jgi:hypothetical protein
MYFLGFNEFSLSSRERFPPSQDYGAIMRLYLHAVALTPQLLAGDKGAATAEKGVIY